MSQRSIQRRIPSSNHKKSKLLNPISSLRSRPSRRFKQSKPIGYLRRCNSEPILRTAFDDEEKSSSVTDDDGLFRLQTCLDIFASPYITVSPSNPEVQRYKNDAKVVVNVTVEGSPGPVRTLVKLGASVEETIKIVVDRYSQEGRSPQLGRDAISSFELHHSHFSLENINKTCRIGDVGARSFYLRKSCSGRSSEDGGKPLVAFSSAPEIIPAKASIPLQTHFVFLPNFIARKLSKIGRRMHKLWEILGCTQ